MSTKQDTLVSGTNIKTINNQSILGSGNIEIEGGSDYNDLSNKPSINGTTLVGNVNLATPEQLNAKQDTLVSGTNIKTINNQSLLGSGNIELVRPDYINELTFNSSVRELIPEIQETGKFIDSSGGKTINTSYCYTTPFILEKGDVIHTYCTAISIAAILSKYDSGNYKPLLCGSYVVGEVKDKYYIIQEDGQYVLSYMHNEPHAFHISKNSPCYLNYKNSITTLETTDNLILDKTNFNIRKVKLQDNTYRLRLSALIPKDSEIFATCTLGKGVACSIYQNSTQVLTAPRDYLQTLSYSYTSEIVGKSTYSGVLVVSLCKTDSSDFSEQEVSDYIEATTITVKHYVELKETKDLLYSNTPFLGQLLNKSLTANGLSDNNASTRVSTTTCMVIPKEGGKLSFILPPKIYIGIRSGNTSSNLSYNDYWFGNGDTYTFREDVHYYRLCFSYIQNYIPGQPSTYSEISVATIMDYIQSGDIRIFIEDWDNDIISNNASSENYIKAIMRNFVSGAGNNGSLHKLPIFAHISDVHGDANRFKSFADYCDYIGVDAALVSGDTVATNSIDSMQYINDIEDTHNTKMLLCMGNHDARNLTTAESQYDNILGHTIQKYEVETNPNEDYPTYYYKDFVDKNIRVISVNLYELSHTGDTANFSQTQCEWLISTLNSTPQNYGVLIMFHSPEKMPQKDTNYSKFYQDTINYAGLQAGISGNPFSQIIDAFIGKTSTTITYTSNNDTSTSISVQADFTNVASGVEFIAFVSGHLHTDRIGYSASTTYKQLNLNVCCGIAIYGSTYPYLANNSDLPRGCNGTTQDSFNIYAIDRDAKVVRIARVGSNVSGELLIERNYMSIPYAD